MIDRGGLRAVVGRKNPRGPSGLKQFRLVLDEGQHNTYDGLQYLTFLSKCYKVLRKKALRYSHFLSFILKKKPMIEIIHPSDVGVSFLDLNRTRQSFAGPSIT